MVVVLARVQLRVLVLMTTMMVGLLTVMEIKVHGKNLMVL